MSDIIKKIIRNNKNKLANIILPLLFFSASTLYADQPKIPVHAPYHPYTCLPIQSTLYDRYPWAATYYYGITGSDALVRIMPGMEFHRWPEHIQSLELSHTLATDNFFRVWLNPIVSVVQISAVVSKRQGSNESNIYEFDPYLGFRWVNFPWNQYVNTSLAIGEGVSYATSVPSLEAYRNTNTKRFLNYLMLEATLAPPSHPEWQLVFRIHHRSGAYGLYHAGNTGSNVVGIGIRYLFD